MENRSPVRRLRFPPLTRVFECQPRKPGRNFPSGRSHDPGLGGSLAPRRQQVAYGKPFIESVAPKRTFDMPNQLNEIKHVVQLMLENRSFDQMLGFLYPAGSNFDGLEG